MTPRRHARGYGALGALLAAMLLAAAATLTGCARLSDAVPGCNDPLRLAIIAQSVPGAAYVPCIRGLPQGWADLESAFLELAGRSQAVTS